MWWCMLVLSACPHAQASSIRQLANQLHQVGVVANSDEPVPDLRDEFRLALQDCRNHAACVNDELLDVRQSVDHALQEYTKEKSRCKSRERRGNFCPWVDDMHNTYLQLDREFNYAMVTVLWDSQKAALSESNKALSESNKALYIYKLAFCVCVSLVAMYAVHSLSARVRASTSNPTPIVHNRVHNRVQGKSLVPYWQRLCDECGGKGCEHCSHYQ